jgi:hypothetical protein
LPSKGLQFKAQKLPIAQTTSLTENTRCVARAAEFRVITARKMFRVISGLSENDGMKG